MDATPHIIESALLLLGAFLLGCVIGHFARRLAGRRTPAPAPAQPVPAAPDDLKKIRGIGPRLEATLNAHGVTRYGQIAAWSRETIDGLDAQLSLRGRIDREQWVEQARALSEPADR